MARVIQYINPTETKSGDYKCAVCGSVFEEKFKARRCARLDHARKGKSNGSNPVQGKEIRSSR